MESCTRPKSAGFMLLWLKEMVGWSYIDFSDAHILKLRCRYSMHPVHCMSLLYSAYEDRQAGMALD